MRRAGAFISTTLLTAGAVYERPRLPLSAAGFPTLECPCRLPRRSCSPCSCSRRAAQRTPPASPPPSASSQREMARAGGVLRRLRRRPRQRRRAVRPHAPTSARMPASVEKLYTTVHRAAALRRRGPADHDGARPTACPDETATIDGNLVPARRRRPDVRRRAGRARSPSCSPTPACTRVTGRVIGDESRVRRASAASRPPATALTSEVGPLERAAFNHGRTGKAAPVLPGQPGPVRRTGVREGAASAPA